MEIFSSISPADRGGFNQIAAVAGRIGSSAPWATIEIQHDSEQVRPFNNMRPSDRGTDMAERKARKAEIPARATQMTSENDEGFRFPGEQERLPRHVHGAYQVAMGTGDEMAV